MPSFEMSGTNINQDAALLGLSSAHQCILVETNSPTHIDARYTKFRHDSPQNWLFCNGRYVYRNTDGIESTPQSCCART